VDDHPLIRERLAELINSEPDLTVCGEAEDVAGALELMEKQAPDVAVVDVSLKNSYGIELLKDIKIRFPKLPVLMLSMYDEALYAERALRAGARGYIVKDEASGKIVEAIRRVLEGEVYVSEKLASVLLNRMAGLPCGSPGSPLEVLSDRELEVFELLGQGQSTRQIAKTLHVSAKTVEAHREHIKAKLKFKSGSELLRYAIECSLFDR
jgi:DNA-binding NarL/FixJ family response regulator